MTDVIIGTWTLEKEVEYQRITRGVPGDELLGIIKERDAERPRDIPAIEVVAMIQSEIDAVTEEENALYSQYTADRKKGADLFPKIQEKNSLVRAWKELFIRIERRVLETYMVESTKGDQHEIG